MGARRTGRIIAFQTIFSWEANDKNIEELLKFEWLDQNQPQNSQNAMDFARLLAAGTVENIEAVDKTIEDNLVNWKFNRLSPCRSGYSANQRLQYTLQGRNTLYGNNRRSSRYS